MQIFFIFSFIIIINSTPLFTNTRGDITQSIYELKSDIYMYTYENKNEEISRIYKFTTEEIITCFVNDVTDGNTTLKFINIILISFSL